MNLRDVTLDRWDADNLTASDRCAVRTMYRAYYWISEDIARYEAIKLAVTLDNMRCAIKDGSA